MGDSQENNKGTGERSNEEDEAVMSAEKVSHIVRHKWRVIL